MTEDFMSNMPSQTLGQDFFRLLDLIFAGTKDVLSSLQTNSPPAVLLEDVLGLSQAQIDALPRQLLAFVGIYLACGALTLLLRFRRGQRSLSSWSKQVSNVIFTVADFILIPFLLLMVEMGRQFLQGVEPYSGELSDLWRFFTQAWGVLFDPVLLCALLICTILMPVQAAWRYLRVYKLFGLPHMVFDVGTGIYLACVAMMSMLTGNMKWYALILLAVVMLCVVQIGGYIPDSRNTAAAHAQAEQAAAEKKAAVLQAGSPQPPFPPSAAEEETLPDGEDSK